MALSFVIRGALFQADITDAFNTTSRYLDDILNVDNIYFDDMESQTYPPELQLNKVNKASFLDLQLSVSNDIVSTKIYDNVMISTLKL